MPLLDPDSLELKLVRHTTLLLSLLLFMLHYSSLIRTKILTIIFLYVVIFRGMFHSVLYFVYTQTRTCVFVM